MKELIRKIAVVLGVPRHRERELTPILDAALATHLADNMVVSRDDLALLEKLNEKRRKSRYHYIATFSDRNGSIDDYRNSVIAQFGPGCQYKTPADALRSLLKPEEPKLPTFAISDGTLADIPDKFTMTTPDGTSYEVKRKEAT